MFSLVSTRTPRSFFARLLSSQVASAHAVAGDFLPQVQDFALLLVELHKVPLGPFLQPVEVAQHGSTSVRYIYQYF